MKEEEIRDIDDAIDRLTKKIYKSRAQRDADILVALKEIGRLRNALFNSVPRDYMFAVLGKE